MRLFDINGTDFTSFITVPSYNINEIPVYEEWTDANKITHRDIIRTRVSGNFTIKFENPTDYWTFVNAVNNNTNTGGYVVANLYINNRGITLSKNVYIEFTPVNDIPFMGVKEHDGIDVTITER